MSKKELILAAATSVFATKGFFTATTGDVAKEAGVAVGTLYNYFASKDEILYALFAAEAQKRSDFAQKLPSESACLLKLKKLIELHFASLQANPNLARVISAEKSVIRKRYPSCFTPDGGIVAILAEILHAGKAKGEVKGNPETVALLIFGMIEGIMEKTLAVPSFNYEQGISELIDLLRDGL